MRTEGRQIPDAGYRAGGKGQKLNHGRTKERRRRPVWRTDAGLAARGSARGNVPGTEQRDSVIHASTVDLDDAYMAGRQAVFIAAGDDSGFMATILREGGPTYRARYDKVPLQVVADSERSFPDAWIARSRTDVTDQFVRYARPLAGHDWPTVPLVGGLQRFARLEPILANQKLDEHVPRAVRR